MEQKHFTSTARYERLHLINGYIDVAGVPTFSSRGHRWKNGRLQGPLRNYAKKESFTQFLKNTPISQSSSCILLYIIVCGGVGG